MSFAVIHDPAFNPVDVALKDSYDYSPLSADPVSPLRSIQSPDRLWMLRFRPPQSHRGRPERVEKLVYIGVNGVVKRT